MNQLTEGDHEHSVWSLTAHWEIEMKTSARLLTWSGPAHYPVPHNGVAARTYDEIGVDRTLPIDKTAYWREGAALFTQEEMKAALAAERERCKTAIQDSLDEPHDLYDVWEYKAGIRRAIRALGELR